MASLTPLSVVVDVAAELALQARTHWQRCAPGAALFFGLHILFGRVLPFLVPSVYDVFNAGALAAGKKPLSRGALAKDVRTRLVSILFAVYVVYWSIVGVFVADDYAYLSARRLDATTPLTVHLAELTVGFFVWDLWVSVVDGYGPAFVFHGAACLAVFLAALAPAMHSFAFVALGFEASTPFLHARRLLIMAGVTRGPVLAAVQAGFAATFFLARILLGYTHSVRWAVQAWDELHHPAPVVKPAVVVMYMALCAGLSALNGWWMYGIVKVACASGRGGGARGEPTAQRVAAERRKGDHGKAQ
jgi:hypothetical protein